MDIFYPVKLLADWFTYIVFKLTRGSLTGEAVNFFIFDSIKIFILVSVVIFVVAIIRTFMQPDKVRLILAHKNRFLGYILAGCLGILTPFCTCSAIPLFLGFIEAGVPLGVTFTFLVASPMINELALVLIFGLFGAKIAFLYVASGLCIAVISGLIISRIHPDKLLVSLADNNSKGLFLNTNFKWADRIKYAYKYTLCILNSIWPYILIGVGVGAWIHGYVPAEVIARFAGGNKWYTVPVAVAIGIPLYGGCAGVMPLISVLTEKGVALGTALAFMMAVTGLSLPEFLILKRAMKLKLILIFAAVVGTGIIFTGYLFNFILK